MKRLLAIPLVLLLCSCSTMTPDRIALLSALAGSAAQLGLQLYLQNNPTHRPGVQAVVDALKLIQVPTEQSVATELQSLPTTTLRGSESELYVANDNTLRIYDAKSGKTFDVPPGLAGEAVARAIRAGMRRAVEPVPPLPARVKRVPPSPQLVYVTNQQVIVLPANEPAFAVARPVVESPTPATQAAKHAPRGRVGIYSVERKASNVWIEVQSFTSGPAEFRVRRVR